MRHFRVATTTDVYQQVIPEGVAAMVDSIHGELRKPGTAAAETSKIAANLRAKKQRPLRAEERKIDANWRQQPSIPVGVSGSKLLILS